MRSTSEPGTCQGISIAELALFTILTIFLIVPSAVAQTLPQPTAPNGCGTGWNRYFVPDSIPLFQCQFKSCCDNHDVCYGKCESSVAGVCVPTPATASAVSATGDWACGAGRGSPGLGVCAAKAAADGPNTRMALTASTAASAGRTGSALRESYCFTFTCRNRSSAPPGSRTAEPSARPDMYRRVPAAQPQEQLRTRCSGSSSPRPSRPG